VKRHAPVRLLAATVVAVLLAACSSGLDVDLVTEPPAGVDLPADLPPFPLPADFTVTFNSADTAGVVEGTTAVGLNDLLDAYEEALPELGWQIFGFEPPVASEGVRTGGLSFRQEGWFGSLAAGRATEDAATTLQVFFRPSP
jgi:hypothetical protein